MEIVETPTDIFCEGQNFSKERVDLFKLVMDVGKYEAGLEVGTHAGVSAEIIAPYFQCFYCVDPYIAGYDESDQSSDEERLKVARYVFENLVFPRNRNIKAIFESSLEASKLFESQSLDFVYIDACHTYEAVCLDIETWLPKIRDGGMIGGHDFTASFPGVQAAVRERLSAYWYYSGGHWGSRVFHPTS